MSRPVRGLAVGGNGDGVQSFTVDHGHHHQLIGVALDHFAGFLDGDPAGSGLAPTVHDALTALEGQDDLDLIIRITLNCGGAGGGGSAEGQSGSSGEGKGCRLGGKGEDHNSQQSQRQNTLFHEKSPPFCAST